jgi:hypothetical protein
LLVALAGLALGVAGTGGVAGAAWGLGDLGGLFGQRREAGARVWTPRKGPVFDWKRLSSTPLRARVLGVQVRDGIVTKRVMFHSHMDGRKSVDIFAFYSYPQQKPQKAGKGLKSGKRGPEKHGPEAARRLSAFVWIEGGLAQAKPFRTVFGARRGYATLAIDFPIPGYRSTGGYPINLGMYVDENPRQAPIYHGAVALLKAVSFLQAQPNVDASRVGMAGSSWGGFYTTLMAGVDPRLKAASAMYGAGNLHLGNMWWDAYGRSGRFPPRVREHWRTSLDPAFRIAKSRVPIAWFSATNDWFFWMPALNRTHAMAGGPKSLSLLANWDHALSGEVSEQAFAWLDVHLKGAPAFLKLSNLRVTRRGGEVWAGWEFSGPRPARFAEVALSPGRVGNWHARAWTTMRATLRFSPKGAKGGRCWLRLPRADAPFVLFGTVEDRTGFRYSTPLVQVNPAALLGAAAVQRAARSDSGETADLADLIDGCAPWGGFERDGLVWLRRHKWLSPRPIHGRLSTDAVGGRKSLRLDGGTTRLPLLRFAEGRRHRLRFWIKGLAREPFKAGLRFNAAFLGQPRDVVRWFHVEPRWQAVEFDLSPHEDLSHRYNAALLMPPGVSALVDSWSLRALRAQVSAPSPAAPRSKVGVARTSTS